MFNDKYVSEVENGIHFVGFVEDFDSNSVIVSGLVEDEEREVIFSVACMEILTFTEVLEEKVFVESAKVILRDSVNTVDIAKLEDLLARIVPSSKEIDAESLELYVKDIRKEFFALRLLSDDWDSLSVLDENLLFVQLANGG